jgi:hypothetical protein
MAQTDYLLTMNNGNSTLTLTPYVASIVPSYQRRNVKTINAIDGTEYAFPQQRKRSVKVTFKPMTGAQLKALYDFLTYSQFVVWYTVTYRDPSYSTSQTVQAKMRVANEWETKYLLHSIDGNRYYAGFEMELREQ